MFKSILLRLLPFLRSQPPLAQERIEHILLVGSGSRLNIERALDYAAARFPAARLALLAEHNDQGTRVVHAGVAATGAYHGLGTAASLRREAAAARYDLKVVLWTGEGQTGLKLLAFYLPARRMLLFTEGGGAFTWSFDDRLAIWNHVRWRMGSGRPLLATLRRLGWAVLNPILSFVAFILLLLWHAGLFVRRILGRRRRDE